MTNISYENDWLGLKPVFYNEKTLKISENINDVIDLTDFDFDNDGLVNYLDYGYSVFNKTPIKNVKYIGANMVLNLSDKDIKITKKKDNLVDLISHRTTTDHVIKNLSIAVNNWVGKVNGNIIIPTSGGFDSRMLNALVLDKERIKAFTYGLTNCEVESYEVVYAREICKRLKIDWREVKLNKFHYYLDDWIFKYGVSVHAHGMYQVEFYEKINKILGNQQNNVLSGIMGDAWSGKVKIPEIKCPKDVYLLGYSHGIGADSSKCKITKSNFLEEEYFESNKDFLKDSRYRIVESMRFKILLLRYLLEVPMSIGFNVWSPFIDINLVSEMLSLPNDCRDNRTWQNDYFKKNNLMVEDKRYKINTLNTLDMDACRCVRLNPLNTIVLNDIFDKDYIKWINNELEFINKRPLLRKVFDNFSKINLFNQMLTIGGFGGYYASEMRAYNAYVTIKPIETLLIRRSEVV